jgi:hypothetical protein
MIYQDVCFFRNEPYHTPRFIFLHEYSDVTNPTFLNPYNKSEPYFFAPIIGDLEITYRANTANSDDMNEVNRITSYASNNSNLYTYTYDNTAGVLSIECVYDSLPENQWLTYDDNIMSNTLQYNMQVQPNSKFYSFFGYSYSFSEGTLSNTAPVYKLSYAKLNSSTLTISPSSSSNAEMLVYVATDDANINSASIVVNGINIPAMEGNTFYGNLTISSTNTAFVFVTEQIS